jgi:hypothetical protein
MVLKRIATFVALILPATMLNAAEPEEITLPRDEVVRLTENWREAQTHLASGEIEFRLFPFARNVVAPLSRQEARDVIEQCDPSSEESISQFVQKMTSREVLFDKKGMRLRLQFDGKKIAERQGKVRQLRNGRFSVRDDELNSQLDVYDGPCPYFIHSRKDLFPTPPERIVELFDEGKLRFSQPKEGLLWLTPRPSQAADQAAAATIKPVFLFDRATGAISELEYWKNGDLIVEFGWKRSRTVEGCEIPTLVYENKYKSDVLTSSYVRFIDNVRVNIPFDENIFVAGFDVGDVIVCHRGLNSRPTVSRAVEAGSDVTMLAQ